MSPPAPASRESRVRGCLLGGAVGDALGAPVEFLSWEEIRSAYGEAGITELDPSGEGPARITDDTQLTLFTAEGLILALQTGEHHRRLGLRRTLHRALPRWLRTQEASSQHAAFERAGEEGFLLGDRRLFSRRAPGATCLAALQAERLGTVEQPLNTSKGCGGVMRVAPVGLVLAVDDPFRAGCDAAALTHGHPSGYLAAGFLAALVRGLVLGDPLSVAVAEGLETLRRQPAHEECATAVQAALALAERGPPAPRELEALGGGWVAEEALAIALACAAAARDFADGVRRAVNHSGDSDSTGAIAGQILGAALGLDAIPRSWLEALELRDRIESMAHALLAANAAAGP